MPRLSFPLRLTTSLCLLTQLALSPLAAFAQPAAPPTAPASKSIEEATVRYKRGVKLFEEQDYNAALLEFRRAYELAPNYRVAYNIGQVYYQLQNYAKALVWFERYINDGGKDVSAERRVEVTREIDELRGRVGRIAISTDVVGAEVFIDDESVGHTPLAEPVLVSVGRRKLVLVKQGYSPSSQVVEVSGGETKRVPVVLVSTAAPQAATQPVAVAPRAEPPSKWTTLSWVGLGTAGALAAGATVTGILALGASKDERDTPYAAGNTSGYDDKHKKWKTLAITTDVLAGAAIVTAGLTLILTATSGEPSGEKTAGTPRKLSVGLSPQSAWVQGSF